MKRDLEHLKLLTVFHYVFAGLVALGSTFALIYVFLGLAIINGWIPGPPPPRPGSPAPPGMPMLMGWMFFGIGSFAFLLGWTMAICLARSGFCLSRRKSYTFCFVMACIACINFPLGTALGVCTILVLVRPKVKDLFAGLIVEYDPEEDEDPYGPVRPRRSHRRNEEEEEDREERVKPRPRPDEDRYSSKD